MSVDPPHIRHDQFIVIRVTGVAGGKNEKKVAMITKQAESILMGRPALPSDHGPKLIVSPLMRLIIMSTMTIRYEVKRPAMDSETMALNATVEPILMSPIIPATMVQKLMDRRGSAVRLSTCERKPENGNPLSRAKAQVCREAEAKKPNEAQTTSAMRMAVITEAPTWEFVASKNTWMKVKPVALFRSASMSPKVKEKAMVMANPKDPFSKIVPIIAQGTAVDALRTSSARWQGPS